MADDFYDVVAEKDIMVPMRDGVRLATDLYFPARDGQPLPGKFPAIFHRTPYDKSDFGVGVLAFSGQHPAHTKSRPSD